MRDECGNTVDDLYYCQGCGQQNGCEPDCKYSQRIASQMRACSDCEAYGMAYQMIRKPDGRVICPSCQKAIEAKAIKTAQSDLFVTQPDLF